MNDKFLKEREDNDFITLRFRKDLDIKNKIKSLCKSKCLPVATWIKQTILNSADYQNYVNGKN